MWVAAATNRPADVALRGESTTIIELAGSCRDAVQRQVTRVYISVP